MINNLSRSMNTSKNNAARLITTESAAMSAIAHEKAYRELDVEMVEVVETLDKRTCSCCGKMDGKIVRMAEYQVGVTVPPFHPWCRGTTVPHFDDEFSQLFDEGKRAARDKHGKTYYVPSDMSYTEWKYTYVDKMSAPRTVSLTELHEQAIIENNIFDAHVQALKDNEIFDAHVQALEDNKIFDEKQKNANTKNISKTRYIEGRNLFSHYSKEELQKEFTLIGDIIQKQGFGGLPTVVNSKELDEYINKHGTIELFRGISTETEEDLNKFQNVFISEIPPYFSEQGKSLHGSGIYTAETIETARHYASDKNFGRINRMTLREEALVLDLTGGAKGRLEKSGYTSGMSSTISNHAAALGYDAIKVNHQGELYYIILNRTAIITDNEDYF